MFGFGLDPMSLGIGLLAWLAFKKQTGTKFGEMTPERDELFRNAMAHCADPARLGKLAEIFRKEGLKAEAVMLRKRAEWRARSDVKRAEHAAIFEKALASENVGAILGVAAAFESLTATQKAGQLRERVAVLNAQQAAKAITAEAEAAKARATSAAAASIPENTVTKEAVAS